MKRPTIIFVGGSMRVNTWRCWWPVQELGRRGYDAVFVGKEGMRSGRLAEERPHEWRYWYHHNDVVLLHATNQDVGHSGTVRALKRDGLLVWLQLDDDYSALGDMQSIAGGWYTLLMADLALAMREAHGVIFSTPDLAARMGRWANRKVVIRNWLPRWITEIPVWRKDPPMVGWFGTMDSHARDIAWLGTEAKAIRSLGVVGAHKEFSEITGADLAWKAPITLPPRLYHLLGRFSVGIAPVKDDTFNASKSWIKPLEFGALGIPTVATTVSPYRQVSAEGLPVAWAHSPEQMAERANMLIDAPDHGETEAGLREIVRDRFTLEGRGGDEWAAWAEEAMAG